MPLTANLISVSVKVGSVCAQLSLRVGEGGEKGGREGRRESEGREEGGEEGKD